MNRDFNDSLDGMFDGKPRPVQERLPDTRSNAQKLEDHFDAQGERENVFNQKCDKCGGSGFWKGNRRFPCFKCKGRGTLSFKTAPEQRAKARARAAEKRVEREADKAVWREQHAAEVLWCARARRRNEERGGTFDFPAKLLEALEQYGIWTEAQTAAVQKLMAREQERRAESQAKRSFAIDATKIEQAFASAREKAARPGALGIWSKPLHLRGLETDFVFQPGSVGSEFEGMIFVKSGERKLGWIKNGVFTRRGACSEAEALAITLVCKDPHAAANAYAKAWSCCGICGRTLTEDSSIARGIGPICAERYGW